MNKSLGKKGDLQISFTWLFAIIVGAFILFLAIYASIRLINVEETTIDLKTGKNFNVLTNPLETGFEVIRKTSVTFPVDTRIHNRCENFGTFGEQKLGFSHLSFGEWTKTEQELTFSNKYYFSGNPSEGKEFILFSKPFDFPFKITDLIYIVPSEVTYCFVNPPVKIKEEIENFELENILFANCPENSEHICFSSSGSECDAKVNYNLRTVEKEEEMYFSNDALMYAAIFSDKETYECQLKRIMKRAEILAGIYRDKANFVAQKGCNSNLNLIGYMNAVSNYEDSNDLRIIEITAEELGEANDLNSECKIW